MFNKAERLKTIDELNSIFEEVSLRVKEKQRELQRSIISFVMQRLMNTKLFFERMDDKKQNSLVLNSPMLDDQEKSFETVFDIAFCKNNNIEDMINADIQEF